MSKSNQQQAELERLRAIIKGVHGALTDSATVPVPDLDADLYESVMQIVKERDEARGEVERLKPYEVRVADLAIERGIFRVKLAKVVEILETRGLNGLGAALAAAKEKK